MENFKPRSLSEMNEEFAQKLAQQIEEKQKAEEAQKMSAPAQEPEIKEKIEDAFQIEDDDDSMLFDGFDFSMLDDDEDDEESIAEEETEVQEPAPQIVETPAPAPQAFVPPIPEPQISVPQEAVQPVAESQDTEPQKEINLFEDVKLPIFNMESEKEIKAELPKEAEYTEPDPKGFFGPPIEKNFKKEKAIIEPKFDFEKTADYSGAQLKKGFKLKSGKSKVGKRILTAAIIVVAVISLVVGVTAFATAEPGRFLLGKGLLICEEAVENTNLTEGTLLFVQAAASAGEDDIVAVYKDNMTEYEILTSSKVTFRDTVFAVVKRRIPQVGKFLSFVNDKWIIFAGAAAALLVILVVVRVLVFKNDGDMIIGEPPRRRNKKQILDF